MVSRCDRVLCKVRRGTCARLRAERVPTDFPSVLSTVENIAAVFSARKTARARRNERL
jgi:hypothetical protein